jgi:hypothetical protein
MSIFSVLNPFIMLLRLLFLCLLNFLVVKPISAQQNLVPNPSFEDTLECPDFPGQVWRANGWYIAEQTPDYFHSCCNLTHPVCGVPNNLLGIRNPVTGMAYCGFGAYASNIFSREKVGTKLSESLTIGTRYYVTFFLSSVSSHVQGINGASDKIGILFSTIKYDLTRKPPTNNLCQVWADSIITDTTGWVKISGSFVADSAYEYITIGNSFTDSATNSVKYWGNGNVRQSYYFIDDVCITTDTTSCDFSTYIYTPSKDIPFIIYPNPALDFITLTQLKQYTPIIITNLLGEVVINEKANSETVTIDISRLPSGMYFLGHRRFVKE